MEAAHGPDAVGSSDSDEVNEKLEALKDEFHRIPNRKMKRDWTRQYGETRSLRSRVRRRVYRVRRYYEGR